MEKFSLKKLASCAQQIKELAEKVNPTNTTAVGTTIVEVTPLNYTNTILVDNEKRILENLGRYAELISTYYKLRSIISQGNASLSVDSNLALLNMNKTVLKTTQELYDENRTYVDKIALNRFNRFSEEGKIDQYRSTYFDCISPETDKILSQNIQRLRKEINKITDELNSLNSIKSIELPDDVYSILVREGIV